MFIILFFTVVGFLAGLAYVMIIRKIRLGQIFTTTFIGLSSLALWGLMKRYYDKQKKKKGGDSWHF